MPKIFGTNLLGIITATIVFYLVGFLWYGFLFHELWMSLSGMTEAEAIASAEKQGIMMYIWGLLITLAQVLGLAFILNHAGASKATTCIKICAIVALLLALPIMAYGALYEGVPLKLLAIDFSHNLIGYCLTGAIISFFRGKDAITLGEAQN